MQVPFLDLQLQYRNLKTQIDDAIQMVLDTSAYVQGPQVQAFERQFAQYLGVENAIGVANGTDALFLALKACGIGPGDEVITAANTFVATAEAISAVGATVVLVDVQERSYTLDPQLIEAAITRRTKAIVPVHLYGQTADMEAIMDVGARHGLKVIEDACQAHGARWKRSRIGTIGNVGCFSCYPGKNLGAFGDAGIVVTNEADIAERVRLLGNHGSVKKYHHEVVGWNSRLDSIQAAVLSIKLGCLEEWNGARRRHAATYQENLRDLPIALPEQILEDHVWHLFVIEAQERDALAEYLRSRGIATGIHYPEAVHMTDAYRFLPYEEGSFPVAEKASSRLLSLPMYPELSTDQLNYVCSAIRTYYSYNGDLVT